MENILATEQEVMLDLMVGAVNPNALSVSISDMDLNVFASSKHVGSKHPSLTTSDSLRLGKQRQKRASTLNTDGPSASEDLSDHWRTPTGGVDHGTNPIPDHGEHADAPTMLLGRVFSFDVPLLFESQVFSRIHQVSKGTLQLMHPGNKTESGGTERWEKVLQHPFELIIRGSLRYQLPISTRTQSVAVEASVMVHPEDGVDGMGRMRIEPVNHDDHWQWVDWDAIEDDDRLEWGERMVEEIE